jgi:transaldolase
MNPLMGIFLDTGNIDEIRRFHALGVIRGVTTNPSILVRDGLSGDWSALERHSRTIAQIVDPLPVSVEVTTNDQKEMREQAIEISGWADNINVKITIHGPEGGTENLGLVHELETEQDVRVNVTAMMSAQQCVLAAMAGATYVSIFGGRVNNMGYDSREEIARTRQLLDAFDSPSKLIVGSTREALNIIEWFEAGADIVTALPGLLEVMLVHPYSKETVQMFLRDGKNYPRK